MCIDIFVEIGKKGFLFGISWQSGRDSLGLPARSPISYMNSVYVYATFYCDMRYVISTY